APTRRPRKGSGDPPSDPTLRQESEFESIHAGASTQIACPSCFISGESGKRIVGSSPEYQWIGSQPAIRAMMSIKSREVVTLRTLDHLACTSSDASCRKILCALACSIGRQE